MKKVSKIFLHLVIFTILTIATQIGGLVYVVLMTVKSRVKINRTISAGLFLGLYLIFSLVLLPFIAPLFGREALPFSGNIQPLNIVTCLLNRHYVSPDLKHRLEFISEKMETRYPGVKLNYLDANFPFYDGFPLLPHLSHDDGKKIDLAFYYQNTSTGEISNRSPSFIGYGAFESPRNDESNYTEICRKEGYVLYNMLEVIAPLVQNEKYALDTERTVELVKLIAADPAISKIFIEPHLKARWGLNGYEKIRFQGCHSVRHDDHIHAQIF